MTVQKHSGKGIRDTYEVLVSNIGAVYNGADVVTAHNNFNYYVRASRVGFGRVSRESVTMLKNGEIVKEYIPERLEDNE